MIKTSQIIISCDSYAVQPTWYRVSTIHPKLAANGVIKSSVVYMLKKLAGLKITPKREGMFNKFTQASRKWQWKIIYKYHEISIFRFSP